MKNKIMFSTTYNKDRNEDVIQVRINRSVRYDLDFTPTERELLKDKCTGGSDYLLNAAIILKAYERKINGKLIEKGQGA